MDEKKTSLLYKILKFFVLLFYPKMEVQGLENLPDGPAIVVANHTQMHGPIAGELYFPGNHYIWCAGQMMHLREVPGYTFEDFWSFKSKYTRWYYRLASYLIAPLSVCIFNNAHTIPVYRDVRLLSTFRTTISRLQEGAKVIIFPEHNKKHSNILYDFEDKFIDTARLYYKRTGEEISFVPMYIAPKLHKMVLGKPVRFRGDCPVRDERRRIKDALMEGITSLACGLPVHTVVPYRNVPKKNYPKSLPLEVYSDDEAQC